jgi:hypothetical protein
VVELVRAHDRRDGELSLAHEWLWVDHQPWLPCRREDVIRVKVLVEENLFALVGRKFSERFERGAEQWLGERMSGTFGPLLEILMPPPRFLGECPDQCVNRNPQTRKQADQHIESLISIEGREVGPEQTPFEEHGVRLCVVIKQHHGTVPLPGLESLSFVLTLSVWPLELQHHVHPIRRRGRQHERHLGACERLTHIEPPSVDASLDEVWKLGEPGSSFVTGRERRQAARDVRLRPP